MKPRELCADLAGDQYALSVGAGLVVLGGDTVTVTGPDRLTWLTTLSSQIVTEIGHESKELLLLDPQGHISHAAGISDDGDTAWLLTEAGRGHALADFLNSMRFMNRVEVVDRSAEVIQFGAAATGPVASAVERQRAIALWRDPWPGVVPGGTSYSPGESHPGNDLGTIVALVDHAEGDEWAEKVLATAAELAQFPLVTDDGYDVPAPAYVGVEAWQARRIAARRPQISDTDERALPHEFDWLRTAVHLTKGCYCGQETVARIVNLGRPPRRLVALDCDGSQSLVPPRGAAIDVKGRRVGHVLVSARDAWLGTQALGLIKRSVRAEEGVVTWEEDGHNRRVSAVLTDVVDPAGRAEASPSNRPGAGMKRLDGNRQGMRIGQ